MAADGQFGALLKALGSYQASQDAHLYLGAALSNFISLNNPLNITLLTSQLLTAPALWTFRSDTDFAFAFLSLFHTATSNITNREDGPAHKNRLSGPIVKAQVWIKAVCDGLDERSPPARHVLVLGGILISLRDHARFVLPAKQYAALQTSLISAVNAAILDPSLDPNSQTGVVLALTHAFQWLEATHLLRLEYDHLLPVLMHAALHSSEGLDTLSVLREISQDVQQSGVMQLAWPTESPSFAKLQRMSSRPLVQALGPLARLVAYTLEQVRDASLVLTAVEDIRDFTVLFHSRWRTNKLSEVTASQEVQRLMPETLNGTLPALFTFFRSVLFCEVVVLRGVMYRSMCDGTLANSFVAPRLAQHVLTILKYLQFILSKLGSATFSQYDFVHLAAIDILAAYQNHAEDFLRSISPSDLGSIPSHPLDVESDLFFFNTAEHLTLNLTQATSEQLLLNASAPYLHLSTTSQHSTGLTPILEAAHSVALAAFAAPQNHRTTIDRIPTYTQTLQSALLGGSISARQFRLAFKHLVRTTSRPPISTLDPDLSSVLLEILHHGAMTSQETPLSPIPGENTQSEMSMSMPMPASMSTSNSTPTREVYLLALIDGLPHTPPHELESWLDLTAETISSLRASSAPALTTQSSGMRAANHLWETIYSGKMDDIRTQICVAWWTSLGGREVCFGIPEPASGLRGDGRSFSGRAREKGIDGLFMTSALFPHHHGDQARL